MDHLAVAELRPLQPELTADHSPCWLRRLTIPLLVLLCL